MKFLRILLFPFAILYGIVTAIRNFLYDKNILKSTSFNFPTLVVGNLSVGGTGKTPHVEYIIQLLNKYNLAMLSRGYKRKSKGFQIANSASSVDILGDEPFQIFSKFPKIIVAVDENRVEGIRMLKKIQPELELILLDDAFQHRKLKAGFYILLSSYSDLYFNDFMLPTGNLREFASGVSRANCIIITKCPKNLTVKEQQQIRAKINSEKPIFFTYIDYDEKVFSRNKSISVYEIKNLEKVILAGTAKPQPFFEYLKNDNDVVLEFPDHHKFSEKEIQNIKKIAKNKLIVTTEKDYVRLQEFQLENVYYLPIKINFLQNTDQFNQLILNYVG